jgi:hypothetical protein
LISPCSVHRSSRRHSITSLSHQPHASKTDVPDASIGISEGIAGTLKSETCTPLTLADVEKAR